MATGDFHAGTGRAETADAKGQRRRLDRPSRKKCRGLSSNESSHSVLAEMRFVPTLAFLYLLKCDAENLCELGLALASFQLRRSQLGADMPVTAPECPRIPTALSHGTTPWAMYIRWQSWKVSSRVTVATEQGGGKRRLGTNGSKATCGNALTCGRLRGRALAFIWRSQKENQKAMRDPRGIGRRAAIFPPLPGALALTGG